MENKNNQKGLKRIKIQKYRFKECKENGPKKLKEK
jgi:hypothetical protein